MSKINLAQQNAVIKCLDKSGIPFTEFFSLFGCSDVNELDVSDLKLAFSIINKG